MNVNYAKFKNNLIVEQFKGNYLKYRHHNIPLAITVDSLELNFAMRRILGNTKLFLLGCKPMKI